ncbi:MAG TPA: hypothetical protein GXX14_09505 [Clostridiaceae bacterium]|nr:hypothetical protein [Clostridiaceae bacterium]
MNERERVMAVLKGEKPDKTPWLADLSYLYTSMSLKGVLEEKYLGYEGYLEFYKDLGAGIYFYTPSLWKVEYTGGVEYLVHENDGVNTFIYKTPKGNLRSQMTYLPETYSWAYTEHFVKNIDDLRIMLYIFEHMMYRENFEEFNRIDKLWGGYGIPVPLAPVAVSALQKLLTRWAGVEKTIEIYTDYKDELEYVIDAIQASEDEVFDILAESPAQVIEFPENLSSEVTGRTFYQKYCMEYYSKRIKQLHDAGKFVAIHIDGMLQGCLPLLEKTGFDIAEAVTPAPVGDIELEKLREEAGEKIIIWGGLPGALFSPHYSEQMFESFLERIFKVFPPGSGFVLGVADQVPPDGLISRVKKVREMIGY